MNEREELFRRLSAACGGHGIAAGKPHPGEASGTPEGDRVAQFAKAFTAAGGFLLRGPLETALSDLGEMLRAEGVTALFFPEDDAAARDIAEALGKAGVTVDRKAIQLADPIKQVGDYKVKIRVAADVFPEISVSVVPET